MKTSKLIAAAALALVAATGAQAETYQGVQTTGSSLSRADFKAQAIAAARAADAFGDRVGQRPAAVAPVADRAAVKADAVAASHNPLQSMDRRAFYRDQVPATYGRRS